MHSFESVLKSLDGIKVMEVSRFAAIDLSVSNLELANIDSDDAEVFEKHIESFLFKNNAEVAFGGYCEKRNLYKRSGIFNDPESEERNIHIGMDMWIKAGTPILAALDGKVHSFKDNTAAGDYGPTIILEHTVEGMIFHTLYGHLSLESIDGIEIGDVYIKGRPLAWLGNSAVNGGYAPHLHFQIIKNMAGHFGDYPGVCSKNDLDFYRENCPDANLLLKINQKP
ncbi:MAG TPA: peptidoglycan DD-metalloendopeptidase family protein [Flavobacterium sp.]|nr:peptidoglycan DD-metalloendopeptidase family protein [Flavobacterium sp.]